MNKVRQAWLQARHKLRLAEYEAVKAGIAMWIDDAPPSEQWLALEAIRQAIHEESGFKAKLAGLQHNRLDAWGNSQLENSEELYGSEGQKALARYADAMPRRLHTSGQSADCEASETCAAWHNAESLRKRNERENTEHESD